MKFDMSIIEQFLNKISNSSSRTLQANVSQLFQYIDFTISPDNLKYIQFEVDRKNKWEKWPKEPHHWTMPIDIDEARSLSYDIYRTIAEQGSELPINLYLGNMEESIYKLNNDF